MATSLQDTLLKAGSDAVTQAGVFLPRFFSALIVFVLGMMLARWCKSLVNKGLHAIRLGKGLKDTPIEAFLKHAEAGKIEEVISSIVFWVLALVVTQSAVSILGLATLSHIFDQIFGYIPNILSATLIVVFGILLAGLVEGVVKGAVRSLNGSTARAMGKVSSYLVMSISLMAAVAELRIAQQFIATLFTGMVAMFALALGLAIGLGSKSTVEKMMTEWYQKTKSQE